VKIGGRLPPSDVAAVQSRNPFRWAATIGGVMLAFGIPVFLLLRRRSITGVLPQAGDVFAMPDEVDGFAAITLLRRLLASPLVKLGEGPRAELQADLKRIEQACFRAGGVGIPEADLRDLLSKWLPKRSENPHV
jgi:hypothetical protein